MYPTPARRHHRIPSPHSSSSLSRCYRSGIFSGEMDLQIWDVHESKGERHANEGVNFTIVFVFHVCGGF
ncbi:hypothetical protein Hanom_Chr01g00059831 [Helianthus anomalus]